MRIGVDISQTAYQDTGVSNYVSSLLSNLIKKDEHNEYILFFSSLRGKANKRFLQEVKRYGKNRVKFVFCPFPPLMLDFLWNKLHVLPIETFIGKVDVFITSDWTEPPATQAKKIAVLYDLVIYNNPEETDKKIIQTQKRRLKWVKKESNMIICISESTKKDAIKLLGIEEERLKVVYPGM